MKHDKFIQALLDNVERFDAEFLKDYKPEDVWIGTTSHAWTPSWWIVRERVRAMIEGLSFKPSPHPETPTDEDFGFFKNAFPDLLENWQPAKPGTVLDVMLK